MAVIVTGGSGFVAATLIPGLLERGHSVLALDNCSRGSFDYLETYTADPNLRTALVDLADLAAYRKSIEEHAGRWAIDTIWHLAANSDIPAGVSDARVDLKDTFMTTFNTLQVMRDYGIAKINFASSSAIYGDLGDTVLTESVGPLLPISNYGAMKLASEAVISAAAESFAERALIFRFPNVVGAPATHGVLRDFILRLKDEPSRLTVLGNGTQQKSYLHVSDLVEAMLMLDATCSAGIDIFNVGPTDKGITVRDIAEITVGQVSPGAEISYGSEGRGWVGDVPKFFYSIDKLKAKGWSPKLSSREAILRAVSEIATELLPS